MQLSPFSAISGSLERWFGRHARDLPWRRHRTPWTALVSEALLQQTQAARVAERFPEFVRRFPDPRSMARRGEAAVLESWRGLGYYRRARLLHAAACAIERDHGGEVPSDPVALRKLPGVGRYTAGAVASIAFGMREPIVDGNVTRVLARLADRRRSVSDAAGQAWCWRQASLLVQAARRPGVTNEALMELGATVCTPAAPACDRCPLASRCGSRRAGSQHRVPRPKDRVERVELVLHALVEIRGSRVGLVRRTDGLWRGLLAPPCLEAPAAARPSTLSGRLSGVRVGRRLAEVEFLTTHRSVRFVVRQARLSPASGVTWMPLHRLTRRAVPAAALRVIEAALQSLEPRPRFRARLSG